MPAITSLPAVLSISGRYWLESSFSVNMASGEAITITADDVEFDSYGYAIVNTASTANLASLIYSSGKKGITVRRVKTRGFMYGVRLEGGDRNRVLDSDISALFRGAYLSGSACEVRGGAFSKIGGFTKAGYENSHTFAIETAGDTPVVHNVLVTDVGRVGFAGTIGESAGVSFSSGGAGGLCREVSVLYPALEDRSFGVWVGAGRVIMENCLVVNAKSGVAYSTPPDGAIRNCQFAFCGTDIVDSNADVEDSGGNT